MPAPISADDLRRLQRQQFEHDDARPPRQFPWTLVVLGLLIAGGAWGYYFFFLKYRLPQERTLHDLQGTAIHARLEGRDRDILRYTLLDDNTVRYITSDRLSPSDQEFVSHLPSELTVTFPLNYLLPAGNGKTQLVRIDARSSDWIKYVNEADNSIHYVPISSLPAADQDVIRRQDANLVYLYPVEYDFPSGDPRGKVSWLGRNDAVVKYMTLKDNVVHYDLISELPVLEQSFVRQLADYVNIEYPVNHDLRSRDGKIFGSRIDGRADTVVKTVSESDGDIHYYAIDDLSDADQLFIRALPASLTLGFPLEMTMSDAEGKPTRVRLEGRNINLVRAAIVGTNSTDLIPINSFTPEEQKVIEQLPVTLNLRYPFDLTLVDDTGRRTQAQVLGRSPDVVQFRMSDGKIYAYELAKLSPKTKAVLEMFPANLNRIDTSASALGGLLTVRTDQAPVLRGLQQRVRQLLAEISPGEARLTSGVTDADRTAITDQLTGPRKELADCYNKIGEILGHGPRKTDPPEVASLRERIEALMKENDNLSARMTDPRSMLGSQRTNETTLNRNWSEIELLIKRIIAAVGLDNL